MNFEETKKFITTDSGFSFSHRDLLEKGCRKGWRLALHVPGQVYEGVIKAIQGGTSACVFESGGRIFVIDSSKIHAIEILGLNSEIIAAPDK